MFTYYVYSMNECLNKIPENSKITVLNIVSTWTYFINVKSPKLQIIDSHVQMRKLLLLCLILSVALAGDDDVYTGPSQQDVVVLDPDNIDSLVYDSDDTWLIELYAPWCGHCKTLRSEWAKLATSLKGVAKVGKLDASIHRMYDQTFGLKGYPHIVLVPGGHKDKKIYYPYEGSRSAERLEEWAYQKIKDSKGFLVPRVVSDETWKEHCTELGKPLCVVVFLPHIRDSSVEERSVHLQMIKEVINNFRDKPISVLWAQANDHPEIEEQFALQSGFPAVLMISPTKRIFMIMRSSFTEENFDNFLRDSIGRRGGGRGKFGSFSKDMSWSTVPAEELEAEPEPEVEVDNKQQQSVEDESL